MALPTVDQADIMRQLGAEYGTPKFAKIEFTPEPYGVIWCYWPATHNGIFVTMERNLFIKPDGTRLAWSPL
jgi:hypothetical protein